jgi:hypothetical protein
VDPELPHCVHKQNPHQHTFPFASAAQNNIPKQKTKKNEHYASPSVSSSPSLRLNEP